MRHFSSFKSFQIEGQRSAARTSNLPWGYVDIIKEMLRNMSQGQSGPGVNIYGNSSWRQTSCNISAPVPCKRRTTLSEEVASSHLCVSRRPPRSEPGTKAGALLNHACRQWVDHENFIEQSTARAAWQCLFFVFFYETYTFFNLPRASGILNKLQDCFCWCRVFFNL